MTPRVPVLILALLASICFTLATWIQPRSLDWRGARAQADTMMKALLGDGRRMFANHFFIKADVYLHSGYYPSIFDQAKLQCEDHLKGRDTNALAALSTNALPGPNHEDDHDHDHEGDIFGQPKDWLDRFGRKFRVTEHKHLSGGSTERELLPWLKISAELDPQRVETYTVAAYWLRTRLHRVDEAQEFLREGLRANPDSHEILFELGQLFYFDRKDTARARNVWEIALRKWQKNEGGKEKPDNDVLVHTLVNLARLEESLGNYAKAVEYLARLKPLSPRPEIIEGQIAELQKKMSAPRSSPGLAQP